MTVREARTETISQLETFQAKLEQFKGTDGILLTEAQKAQNEITAAVSKSYDKDKIKGQITSGIADGIRKDIKLLAKNSSTDTVPKILALLQKLIDLGADLTPAESQFYDSLQESGFEKVSKDNGSPR